MTAPVPPGLCSALVGRDRVGGEGGVGKGGVSRWRQSTFPSTPLGVESATLGAGDRSREMCPQPALTPPLTGEKTRASPSFMPASLSKTNKTAHLFLSPTDFLGNGLLVPLM